MDEQVAAVRSFNRFYTNVIGALRGGLLHTPYSLTEARVIFELGRHEAIEVAALRRELDIDAGYLSRILARFESRRIMTRARSKSDARRQVIRLTNRGRKAFATLDARSADEVGAMLARLGDEERRRLVGAMESITRVLEDGPRREPFLLRPATSGDFGWVVQRHGALYAQEYGWDESFEALVARIVADYIDERDPKRDNAWIAEVDGAPVGCVFCVAKKRGGLGRTAEPRLESTAQLRLLLVEPRARGMGIGSRLVDECLRFARRAGYTRMTLWTNDVLVAARRIYEGAGFGLVEEEAHHSFGHDLVGQNWARDL
ncbi:MAG: bifunctional helix-turn-helix transcriptional regulator/GNAT family N-acetyltransferase [Actinomycetota bacterium]